MSNGRSRNIWALCCPKVEQQVKHRVELQTVAAGISSLSAPVQPIRSVVVVRL